MKRILVPTINCLASSEAAYRVTEIADAIRANIFVLSIAQESEKGSYRRGVLSIEIFEEAAQNYDLNVDGLVVTGEPEDQIRRMARELKADLILLGASEECDWNHWYSKLKEPSNFRVQVLEYYMPNLSHKS